MCGTLYTNKKKRQENTPVPLRDRRYAGGELLTGRDGLPEVLRREAGIARSEPHDLVEEFYLLWSVGAKLTESIDRHGASHILVIQLAEKGDFVQAQRESGLGMALGKGAVAFVPLEATGLVVAVQGTGGEPISPPNGTVQIFQLADADEQEDQGEQELGFDQENGSRQEPGVRDGERDEAETTNNGGKADFIFAHFAPEGGNELLSIDPAAGHATEPERNALEGLGPLVEVCAERPLAFLDSSCHVIQSS